MRVATLVAVGLCLAGSAKAADRPLGVTDQDEATLRTIVANLEAEQADPHVSPKLDWENAFGVRYHDLKARDAFYGEIVKPQMAAADDHTLETKIQFVSPTVALADAYWHIAGQVYGNETKPGPDRWGRTTYVFTKIDGTWTEVIERVADLRRHYYEHFDAMPKPAPVPREVLAGYAGRYTVTREETSNKVDDATVVVSDNGVVLTRGDRKLFLVPTSTTEFLGFYAPDDFAEYVRVTFNTDGAGFQLAQAWGEPLHAFVRQR